MYDATNTVAHAGVVEYEHEYEYERPPDFVHRYNYCGQCNHCNYERECVDSSHFSYEDCRYGD